MKTSWTVGPSRFERAVITIDPWQVELGLGWHELYDFDTRKDVALEEWSGSSLHMEAANRFDAATMNEVNESVIAARTDGAFEQRRARDEQLASAWKQLPVFERGPIERGVTVDSSLEYTASALKLTLGEPQRPGLVRPYVAHFASGAHVLGDLKCFVEVEGGWLLCSGGNELRFVDRGLQAFPVELSAFGVEPVRDTMMWVVACGRRGPLALANCHGNAHPRSKLAQVTKQAFWLACDGPRVVGRTW
ncbi:MAG: hypothetical protein JNM69_32235 [Archangium sp.]|nr:hypothetical protein [Archangium sp.]